MKNTKIFLKRTLTVLIVLLMLLSTVSIGITSAAANNYAELGANVDIAETSNVNHSGGYVYFDNSKTKWNDANICLIIGREEWNNNWSSVYKMTKIANTNLYYYQMPKWENANYTAVIGTSDLWGDGNWYTSNLSNATHYTSAYKNNTFTSGNYYLLTPSSASNGTSFSISNVGSVGAFNTNQAANVYSNAANSSTYASDSRAGTVSVSGYSMSGLTSTSSLTYTSKLNSTAKVTAALARASIVTMTATAADGYTFAGWYNSAGVQVADANTPTYTYTCSGSAATYNARFDASVPHKLTVQAGEGGTVTGGGTFNKGETPTITATPKAGYTFGGWEIVSGTGTIANSSAASTTVTMGDDDITVKAKFNPTYGAVKFQAGANGSVSNAGSDSVLVTSTVSSTATANAGYKFSEWTISGGTEGTDYEITSGSLTSSTIGIKLLAANKTITATASFESDVYITGDFNSWSETATPLVPTKNPQIVRTDLALEAGTYTFKIKSGGTYYSSSSVINEITANPVVLTAGSADNCTFNVAGGKYTVFYDVINNTLEIIHKLPEYKVAFIDWNGAVLKEEFVEQGMGATAPTAPARDGYVFVGWDTKFDSININTVVSAIYVLKGSTFTVIFEDYNGRLISKQTVSAGESVTPPQNPTREGDAQYTYTFSGWNKDFSVISDNITITATYIRTANKYTVTFTDYDDTVLKTEEVEYGKSATAPSAPSRDGYIFTCWDKDFTFVTASITVKAQYEAGSASYTVNYYNWDGSLFHTETVAHGKAAAGPSENPTRDGDGHYTYNFVTWSEDLSCVTSDLSVNALFAAVPVKFTVTFRDQDGYVISTQQVPYGSAAVAPDVDIPSGYIGEWDTDFSFVKNNLTVSLVLQNVNVYISADWADGENIPMNVTDNANIYSYTVELEEGTYGFSFYTDEIWYSDSTITLDGNTNGWISTSASDADAKINLVSTGESVEIRFNKLTKQMLVIFGNPKYTVTFKNYDGTVLKSESVESGMDATAPSVPYRAADAQYTYTFSGWDVPFTNVTEDITVVAQYTKVLNKYVVTFADWDYSVIEKQTVEYGSSAVAPTAPTRANYTFTGWNKSFTNVTSNIIVVARYAPETYTVSTSAAAGGTASSSGATAAYGEEVTLTASANSGYTFTGWTLTGDYELISGSFTASELKIRPLSDITATANFTNTATLTIHTYSANSKNTLYVWQKNSSNSDIRLNGDWPGTAQPYKTTFNNISWKSSKQFTLNNSYTNFVGAILSNSGSDQTADIELQSLIYKNGVWTGVDEIWIYQNGTTVTVTTRSELLDLIDILAGTYNGGTNAQSYTEASWTAFKNAYEDAVKKSGAYTSTQTNIDTAKTNLLNAYNALVKESYVLVSVTQNGASGKVALGNTTITETSGTAKFVSGNEVSVDVTAPSGYFISSIVSNGEVLFSNSTQTVSTKTVSLGTLTEDAEVEVSYERKETRTITIMPYDGKLGTLYHNGVAINSAGETITVGVGETLTLSAEGADGYCVDNWLVDDTDSYNGVSSLSLHNITANHTVEISWIKETVVDVTIAASPVSGGTPTAKSNGLTASAAGKNTITIDAGSIVNLTANVADERFKFVEWYIVGGYTAADGTTRYDEVFNIIATGDITVTAMYTQVSRKIYLNNAAGWSTPHIYYWNSSTASVAWPGTAMKQDTTTGFWYGFVPIDTKNIEFNNGSNDKQTDVLNLGSENLYNNSANKFANYVDDGYYLQGKWNGATFSAFDYQKFNINNGDGTYSIKILVTSTTDGYIYVNPTDENSKFWIASTNGNTANPQKLTALNAYTDKPNYVKVLIDAKDFTADCEVVFTFNPSDGTFSWTTKLLPPTTTVIGSDGITKNSADSSMVTNNGRVGNTYFKPEDVLSVTCGTTYETALVSKGQLVTFFTQVNPNGFTGNDYGYDYYVYGWVINGTEFVYATNMGNGLYSGSYVFTEETSSVVPVYFHTAEWLAAKGTTLVTVYAVVDKNIENWDKYLATYTWYNDSDNALDYELYGTYPGQLMVPVAGLDGVYYTYVETTSANSEKISGIIFSNYGSIGGMDTVVVDYTHIQTYDYYEFMALLEDSKSNITFVIKNTNNKDNSGMADNNDVTLNNYVFEQYKDYSNLKIDIFGNNIESIDSTLSDANAVYIIQDGDQSVKDGSVLSGDYYVKCYIYNGSGKYLGSCYSYELHKSDSTIWTILAGFKNQRAYFSYEYVNGNRYDGEWYGDSKLDLTVNISVNVGITTDDGENITINQTTPVNVATYGSGYVNTTKQTAEINRGTNFTLTATPAKGYRFVGWYSQNGTLFSTNVSCTITSAVGATYTAVFEELDANYFYVNHYIYTGAASSTGGYIPKAHGGRAQLYVGIENTTMGTSAPFGLAESASVEARVGDELVITIATDALGADKFYAWYTDAQEKHGLTFYEEVGVDSVDNIYNNNGTVVGRTDMVYFRFKYTVIEGVGSFNFFSDLIPTSADVVLEYQYSDRSDKIKSYYVFYTLTDQEIDGFAGNNFTPYTLAYISGSGWTNTILAKAPYIADLSKDTNWVINSSMYDTMSFVLWATQPETQFTVTSQVGDSVLVSKHYYSDLIEIDVRDIDKTLSLTGFWYNDVNNDGSYTKGVDLILTYGPHYAYRITCDMNINYTETDKFDFEITIDEPAYGREQTSNEDGSNKKDKVTVDYMINILTPYFYGNGNNFVPSDDVTGNPNGQHVTVESLRNADYKVTYGVILEQVGSFAPGSKDYPTFEDALKAAQDKNYGVATDAGILTGVIQNYTGPVKTSVGTYCTLYDCSNYNITNKNRFGFTIGFNNTAANQKKFFNVYSYVTVTTPEGVTTTYISNVQTLNIYITGVSEASVNDNTSFA